MANRLRTPALLALALGAAGNWHPAAAAEFQCRNGDLVRRIELSGPDTTSGAAACEVRYWRNAKAPETGRTLWRANQDTQFCAAKARQLVARLEAGGWTCSSSEQAASAAPMQAAGADPEPAPRAAPRPAAPAQITRASEPEPPDTTPSVNPPSSAAAQTEPPAFAREPPSSAAAQTEPSASPTESRSPAAAQTEPSAPDDPLAASPASPKAALLDQIVEQTLDSVQELYGGQFQADFAAFGDLDGDGLEDAAVLITYEADRKEYVQYLVAYLFDGGTFQSVATRNVGGRFLDAVRADLQGIADGKILVELEALDGGATCCATHRTAFALEKGRLVEVDHPGAASLDWTSPAEKPLPG
jgi:hypothetical protein